MLAGIIFLLFNIAPNSWNIYIMAFLMAFEITLILSVVMYAVLKPVPLETGKALYRRAFRKSLLVGFVIFVLLVVQINFNLI